MGKDLKIIMEFDFMHKNKVMSTIKLFENDIVKVEDFTDINMKKAFGSWSKTASKKSIYNLFEDRSFPRSRANEKDLLSDIGLTTYDSFIIIKNTHGVMADDFSWIRFADERGKLIWDDVKNKEIHK